MTIRPQRVRPHMRQDGLGAEEGGFQVDRNRRVEIGFGEIVDASDQRDAGIVDKDIDRTEFAFYRSTIAVTAALLETSAARGDGAAADGGNLGGDALGLGGAVAIVDGDVGPGFGQSRRDGGANAAGGAGDEGNPAGQRR